MVWQGDHPISAGAQKVDFIGDENYEVTPLLQGFADVLNQSQGKGHCRMGGKPRAERLQEGIAPFGLYKRANLRGVRSGLSPKRSVVLGGETCRPPRFQ